MTYGDIMIYFYKKKLSTTQVASKQADVRLYCKSINVTKLSAILFF